MKKGESISMSVIIIAAIALLVLIILAVLVLRAGDTTSKGTSCYGVGGKCVYSCEEADEGDGSVWTRDFARSGKTGGCTEDQICCTKVNNPIEQPYE